MLFFIDFFLIIGGGDLASCIYSKWSTELATFKGIWLNDIFIINDFLKSESRYSAVYSMPDCEYRGLCLSLGGRATIVYRCVFREYPSLLAHSLWRFTNIVVYHCLSYPNTGSSEKVIRYKCNDGLHDPVMVRLTGKIRKAKIHNLLP